MTLASWLMTAGLSDAECARQLGVSRQALSRYKALDRFPRQDVLKRIHMLTGGEVTANDFVVGAAETTAPAQSGEVAA